MAGWTGSQDWIFTPTCILLTLISVVRADNGDVTAVIAASAVAVFMLFLFLAFIIFFLARSRKRKRKIRKAPQNGSAIKMVKAQPTVKKKVAGKAYTQNAASPRQRPPVMFYTVNSDPRTAPQPFGANHPGMVTIGPRHPYGNRTLGQVGQPVLFLDWTPGATNTTGPRIKEMPPTADKKDPKRKSKRKMQESSLKVHSKTDSRNGEDSGHHSHNDTDEAPSLIGTGNFMLSSKDLNMSTLSRKRDTEDVNNNQGPIDDTESDTVENFLLQRIEESRSSRGVRGDNFVQGDGPFSVTQLRSSQRVLGSTAVQDQEEVMTFGAETDDKVVERVIEKPPPLRLSSLVDDTPRTDYSTSPRVELSRSQNFRTSSRFVEDSVDSSPRVDYGAMSSPRDQLPVQSPRVDYLAQSQSHSKRNERPASPAIDLDDIIAMGGTSHYARPQTQIETGEIEMGSSPVRMRSARQMPEESHYASVIRRDKNPLDRLDSLARSSPTGLAPPPPPPPPPPPLPPLGFPMKNVRNRPPTPPPGKLLKKDAAGDLDDIINFGRNKPASTANQKKESGLPFMEELRKRQSIFDEGDVLPPMSQNRSAANRLKMEDYDLDLGPSGARRGSLVQFVAKPPEIIPDADYTPFQSEDYQTYATRIPSPPSSPRLPANRVLY